jgi:hypothetical protein
VARKYSGKSGAELGPEYQFERAKENAMAFVAHECAVFCPNI